VSRPQDYLLWNRLGSSLSNGNKPEESLGAYREALMLRPTYTRAIYNVGVACKWHKLTPSRDIFADAITPYIGLNIGAYKEAAEHLLSALSMQEATEEKSKQLWQTLHRAFIAMVCCLSRSNEKGAVMMCCYYQDRKDLADLTDEGPNLDYFRTEGFEF
jgi:peroxin-5